MSRSVKKIPKLRTRGRENRRKLLREAQRLMLKQQDGDTLKFSDVFEAAGVSRGSAYRIYIGLDDLMQDIATDWVVNFVDFLRSADPDVRPESWAQLSDYVVVRGAEYWAATADTLRLLPRLRTSGTESYRLAVQAVSTCIAEIFDRYFVMPDGSVWLQKVGFFVELCDLSFADGVRTEGRITDERIDETQLLAHVYLGLHLPDRLPLRQRAS